MCYVPSLTRSRTSKQRFKNVDLLPLIGSVYEYVSCSLDSDHNNNCDNDSNNQQYDNQTAHLLPGLALIVCCFH
uniref:Uncharacterized protein n=1 Tax=Arion vulgaris TaxID=1028688 RepID=A0A0B6ZS65_9EUPU